MGKAYKMFEKACYKGMHKANKKGMRNLRNEIKEGTITKEEFNDWVYGTNDKDEIRKIRKNII